MLRELKANNQACFMSVQRIGLKRKKDLSVSEDSMDQEMFRIDFIYTIASKLQGNETGRTALMKLAYFAQELKRVPLGYNFILYSYGPFDSSVLSDLDIAQTMTAVNVRVNYHGRGLRISDHRPPRTEADKEIARYSGAIEEIVERFGLLKPSELELLSTLVYVDRNAEDKNRTPTFDRLIENTHEIKSHFSKSTIKAKAEELANEGILHTKSSSGLREACFSP
jgi:uncharacterized protein